MKVLAFFALSAVATAAMAVQPASTITLSGPSTQNTSVNGATLTNTSGARNEAMQNVASNAGPVQVFAGGSSNQQANLNGGTVSNEARGDDAVARQNLASNNGAVEIKSSSNQTVNTNGGTLSNLADGSGAKASQNIASNFGHVVVAAASNQTASFNSGGSAINKALGSNSYAVQNISSNDACAEDPCPGGNCAPTKPGKPGGKW